MSSSYASRLSSPSQCYSSIASVNLTLVTLPSTSKPLILRGSKEKESLILATVEIHWAYQSGGINLPPIFCRLGQQIPFDYYSLLPAGKYDEIWLCNIVAFGLYYCLGIHPISESRTDLHWMLYHN